MFLSIGSEERPERVRNFAEALQAKGLENGSIMNQRNCPRVAHLATLTS